MDREDVEIPLVKCIGETSKAILVLVDGDEKVWLPRSQVSESSEVRREGDEGNLVIPEWLAEEKGLL